MLGRWPLGFPVMNRGTLLCSGLPGLGHLPTVCSASEEVVQLSIIYRTKGIKNQSRASCYRKQGLTETDQGAPAIPQRPLLITEGFPFQVLSQSRSFYR